MVVRLKWFPPSWIQLKINQKIVYIDPAYMRTYYTKYPKKIEFSKWPDPIDGLPEQLEKADAILISHDHKDHVKAVTVNRLRRSDTLVLAPERCKKILGSRINIIEPGNELTIGTIRIKTVDAYNIEKAGSKKIWHRKGDGVGFLITADGKTIYHAGDTDFIPEMRDLGAVDVALLPIGGNYTMGIDDAVRAAIAINPKVVIPMHHLKANPLGFKNRLEAKSKIKAMLLQIGEVYYFH